MALPDLEQQQAVSGPWYGLVFDLDLGSLGGLAGELGSDAKLLLAWTVGGTGASAGIKLPGIDTQGKPLSLEGVLKLDMASIRLRSAATKDERPAYLLTLNRIA